ncbi:MAG: phosphatidylserine decarboxylase family protein [Muribaculaceae bacterium]|nr:phosphatidylserine decarboxylase family protein [Muribaculaceae bacterium]
MKLKRVKIHHEGVLLLTLLFIVLGALNVPLWLFMPTVAVPVVLSALSLLCYLFVFNFFRSPKRDFRGDRKGCVVSSADGHVVVVERTVEPEFIKGEAIQVSVFMSPLNVHANWFPVDGEVEYVAHHPGRFYSAWLPKSSTENERSTVGILSDSGRKVTLRQVAGAMARRIVTYAEPGVEANIDDHLGFIKFGSRIDIYLPLDTEILVKVGDKVKGGVSLLGRLVPKELN